MKRSVWGWCAAAVFGVVFTAAAQTGGSQPGQPASTEAAGKVTLTGCLQADQSGSTFWLSDATKGKAETTGTASGSGTAGSAEQKKAMAMAETYRLNPTGSVSLKPHVGHKVEITGTLADASARGTSGTTPPATPPASGTGAMKDLGSARQVDVTAVKHISPTCEPGKQ